MILTEAWKSGQAMRRKGELVWREPSPKMVLSSEDVLAEDWEVLEQRTVVDLETVKKAWGELGFDRCFPAVKFEEFCWRIKIPGFEPQVPAGNVNGKALGRGLGSLIPEATKA